MQGYLRNWRHVITLIALPYARLCGSGCFICNAFVMVINMLYNSGLSRTTEECLIRYGLVRSTYPYDLAALGDIHRYRVQLSSDPRKILVVDLCPWCFQI